MLYHFEKYVPKNGDNWDAVDSLMVRVDTALVSANEDHDKFLKDVADDPVHAIGWSQPELVSFALAKICWSVRQAYQKAGPAGSVAEARLQQDRWRERIMRDAYRFNSTSLAQNLVNEVNRAAACRFLELVDGLNL